MDLGFRDKVALVTGAGSQIGFGKEIALLLVKEGCRKLAVSDIDTDDIEKTAEALKQLGAEVITVKADITKKAELKAMAEKVMAAFGRIDILCNVAGAILHKDNVPLDEQDEEVWTRQIKLNLFGTMLVTQAVLPYMRKQKSGAIVNIGSGSTHQYSMGVGSYALSKYAIDLFTKQLAFVEAKNGIRVNCVAPGPANTNFGSALHEGEPPRSEADKKAGREALARSMPLGRIGTPADIAYATAFLASDLTGYVTGQIFHVSGGSVM